MYQFREILTTKSICNLHFRSPRQRQNWVALVIINLCIFQCEINSRRRNRDQRLTSRTQSGVWLGRLRRLLSPFVFLVRSSGCGSLGERDGFYFHGIFAPIRHGWLSIIYYILLVEVCPPMIIMTWPQIVVILYCRFP